MDWRSSGEAEELERLTWRGKGERKKGEKQRRDRQRRKQTCGEETAEELRQTNSKNEKATDDKEIKREEAAARSWRQQDEYQRT